MRRPEKHFWYFVVLLSAVFLLGLSGQLISCASAEPHVQRGQSSLHGAGDHGHAPWNDHASVNEPGPTVTSGPGITLDAQADRGAILYRTDGLVRIEVNVNTGADGAYLAPQDSDIVVVVDTSGSVEGEKLRFAKQALHELLARMGPSDRFGLIEYSESARVLVPLSYAAPEQKHQLHSTVDRLTANGSTNLSDGLEHALHLFRGQQSVRRAGRVILLSDGLANAGDSTVGGLVRRAQVLSHSGIAVTTMGIGEDFDENMMTHLATAGTGAFYYLSKLSYLSEFLDNELSSTRETYAQGAELLFEPARGVSLIGAMGLPIERRGGTQTVRLGSLYGSRTRTVWLTLRVPTGEIGMKELGSLSLAFSKQGHPGLVSVGTLPPVACLSDYARFQDQIRKPVWERALLGDVFTTTEERFGDAIRTGSRSELQNALAQAERERRLAQDLGSQTVLKKLDTLTEQARHAEAAQSAPLEERNRSAKSSKSRGYQMRNQAVYKDSEAAMDAY